MGVICDVPKPRPNSSPASSVVVSAQPVSPEHQEALDDFRWIKKNGAALWKVGSVALGAAYFVWRVEATMAVHTDALKGQTVKLDGVEKQLDEMKTELLTARSKAADAREEIEEHRRFHQTGVGGGTKPELREPQRPTPNKQPPVGAASPASSFNDSTSVGQARSGLTAELDRLEAENRRLQDSELELAAENKRLRVEAESLRLPDTREMREINLSRGNASNE